MTPDRQAYRALILGGSSELALMLLTPLLDRNIHPIFTYRNADGKARILQAAGPCASRVDLLHLDFADEETLKNLTRQLSPAPDYLVDFAQSDYESLVGTADIDQVRAYFQTNVVFRAAVLKLVSRAMLSYRRGRLVFISSTAAATPAVGQGFYAAAKLAAEALYRNLALEMAPKGITAVVLRPGYILAGRGSRYLAREKQTARKLERNKQILSPEEVISSIIYLLLQAGAGINASTLTIDGGLTTTK